MYVIARLTLSPGTRSTLVDAVKAFRDKTRMEAGCRSFDCFEDPDHPDRFVFCESWESEEALARHMGAEHMAAWRAKCAPHALGRSIEVILPQEVRSALPAPR